MNKNKVAIAPGRVNLIGEHTDYNGLPVLPVAIDKTIRIEFSPRNDEKIYIANETKDFEPFSFDTNKEIIPFKSGHWGNYVKAAVWGIKKELHLNNRSIAGFDAVVSGDIPKAGGLSSSSALVVATAMVFNDVNKIQVSKIELAEILARAEKFVGTQGGGMDQAISLMGKRDHALKIDFFPLRTTAVPIPPDFAFVVCNSLVKAEKTVHAKLQYNRRPIECRLVTAIMTKAISEKLNRPIKAERLGDLLKEFHHSELLQMAKEIFIKATYKINELQVILETPINNYLSLNDGSLFPEPENGFKLYQRFLHVITEAERVNKAVDALKKADFHFLGQLMNDSHTSCHDYYEISCPELEALVEIARNAGAAGSRLTGAGFGGCTVNLVRRNQINDFIKTVTSEYYENYLSRTQPDIKFTDSFDNAIFAVKPVAGARVE